MKIKTRLSVQFTLIVAVSLLFFSALVYYFYYSSELNKFRQNLLDRAKNTAILLIDVSEVDSTLLKKIHQTTISWEREEILLTDSADRIIYSNNLEYLRDRDPAPELGTGEHEYYSINEKDGVFYSHTFNNRHYNVFVMAFDVSRNANLKELREILLWSILFSIWLSVLFSYFFSRKAIKPIAEIIRSMKEINSRRLNKRLDEGKGKDEIDQLAITFNEMLTNLEISFRNQEDFVSNASHELRTPFTIMTGETDYILSRERTTEEYVQHLRRLSADLKNLNGLLSNLLELAQVNRDKGLVFRQVRIDDIVYNAISQVRDRYPSRKIIPEIYYPADDRPLSVEGNGGLLTIALRNLIDNACKFSGDDVRITCFSENGKVLISIIDTGIGIPEEELDVVTTPFKRASNAKYIGGFGIGLSLVSRIFQLHNVKFEIKRDGDKGTRVEIEFNLCAEED